MSLSKYFQHVYELDVVRSPNFHLVEPRKVAAPGGYQAFRNVACGLFHGMRTLEQLNSSPLIMRPITTVSSIIINESAPIYFVQDSFARAVVATRLPTDMAGTELLWPREGFVLGLPDSFLRDYLGVDTGGYIYVAHMPEGEYQAKQWLPPAPKMVVPYNKFGFFFYRTVGTGYSCQMGAYAQADALNEAPFKRPYLDFTGAEQHQIDDYKETVDKVGSFLIKMMVVLSTNSSYAQNGVIQRPLKRNKSGQVIQRELWSPNFIGKNFQVKRSSESVGAHSSPMYHIRSGHIVHQRVGRVDENFVSASTIPKNELGDFEWSKVSEQTRIQFWQCHRRIWVAPTEVGAT